MSRQGHLWIVTWFMPHWEPTDLLHNRAFPTEDQAHQFAAQLPTDIYWAICHIKVSAVPTRTSDQHHQIRATTTARSKAWKDWTDTTGQSNVQAKNPDVQAWHKWTNTNPRLTGRREPRRRRTR